MAKQWPWNGGLPGADRFALPGPDDNPPDFAAWMPPVEYVSPGLTLAALAGTLPAEADSGVGTAGDVALNAPAARAQFHLDGTGLRIGIISDSFDQATATARGSNPNTPFSAAVQTEIANGELPNVVVLGDTAAGGSLAATDEGRAMAELVHQIAPGAQIYFMSRGSGESGTAKAVAALQAAGANIIVDDVSWSTLPFFQTGSPLQNAVTTATDAGVSYFTSAGNQSGHFYEASATALATQALVLSGATTIEIDLQWTQPFRSFPSGATGSAYSLGWQLYDHGTGTLLQSQTANRTGQDPKQDLTFSLGAGTYDLVFSSIGTPSAADLAKVVVLSSDPTGIAFGGGAGSGTVIGHQLVSSANVVGAVNANAPSQVESYSAFGGGTLYYDAAGQRLAAPVATGKPDFLAPDAVTTTVAGFSTFAGTSAAAPNAAAVGALLLQINPNLTPAELQAALEATAGTAGLSGAAAQIGAGLINAAAAAELLYNGFTVLGGSTIYNGTSLSHSSVLAWNGGTGNWQSAADWQGGTGPGALSYVTLGNNLGALTTDYTVQLRADAGTVGTLMIGNAGAIATALHIAASGALIVAGGATLGHGGTLTIAAAGLLDVDGKLRLDDTTGSTARLKLLGSAQASAGSFDIVGGLATIDLAASLAVAGAANVGMGTQGILDVSGQMAVAGGMAVGAAGTLAVDGTITVAGTMTVAAGGSATIAAGGRLVTAGVVGGGSVLAAGGRVAIENGATLEVTATGTAMLTSLTGLVSTVFDHRAGTTSLAHIALTGLAYDSSANQTLSYASGRLTIRNSGTMVARLSFDPAATLTFFKEDDGHGHLQIGIACYLRGTRIATRHGEVAVEALRIGDEVITAGGACRPVRWIGRRAYSAAEAAADRSLRPIRIAAGALGPLLPRRDLHVSPQHALRLRDPASGGFVLVPAVQLVNGVTITRSAAHAAIAYFHVELDGHDLILAEGQPAETFVDRNSRGAFANAAEYAALHSGASRAFVPFCLPRVEDGPALARIRAEIAAWGGIAAGRLRGFIDRITADGVEGWAHADAGPVMLEVVVDGAVAGVVLADRHRPDLAAMDDGHCAFFFALPPGLRIAPDSTVAVRRVCDGAALPRTIASLGTDRAGLGNTKAALPA